MIIGLSDSLFFFLSEYLKINIILCLKEREFISAWLT